MTKMTIRILWHLIPIGSFPKVGKKLNLNPQSRLDLEDGTRSVVFIHLTP